MKKVKRCMLDGQTWPDFGQGIWPDFGLHEKLYTNFFEREKIYVNILNPFSQRGTYVFFISIFLIDFHREKRTKKKTKKIVHVI